MKSIASFVEENQLTSFFVLTIFISTAIWMTSPFVSGDDMGLQRIVDVIGAYGPALSAVIVSIIAGSKGIKFSTKQLQAFFISLPVVLAICFWALKNMFNADYSPAVVLASIVISLMAALMISLAKSNDTEIKDTIGSLLQYRLGLKWYLFAIFLFPAAALMSITISTALGNPSPVFYQNQSLAGYLFSRLLLFLAMMLFGGSLNEEPGWRGFAMNRLLKKHNPAAATLILGIIWTVWHGPLHFNGFYQGGGAAFLQRFVFNIPLTFFFTWLHIRTKGNVLVAVLLHTSINFTFAALPMEGPSLSIASLMLILILAVILMFDPLWRSSKDAAVFDIGI